jgi:hypothetical protein
VAHNHVELNQVKPLGRWKREDQGARHACGETEKGQGISGHETVETQIARSPEDQFQKGAVNDWEQELDLVWKSPAPKENASNRP